MAISVSGQSGLARFIKLPPVEAKKIPDIVRYEARQQIPFDLNDVIWDYQRMGGGSEEEGFALETEIGLFAMKRDAVFRALEPFQKAGIELDFVQLTPLALYNYVLFDQLRDLPPIDEYDPENPPESVVVVSLGTDSTDLVVTNGYRVWQRSVPLGGNHFTKALTKELKLTFAKAEHLKRNAAQAQDPKAIFQAMRPVFNDLLTELQRSLGFFSNIDRHAKIGRIVALGNAFKLPGLRRFLSQSLGYDIQRVEAFRGLEGPEIVAAPSFKENVLSFGVCYGLTVQGLNKGGLRTNLLPKQIVRDRLIREKKPWAVAAAAALLLACSLSFASYASALWTLEEAKWRDAETQAKDIADRAARLKDGADKAVVEFNGYKQIGDNLVGNVEKRVQWLELLAAINEALPRDDHKEMPKDATKEAQQDAIMKWKELHVESIDCQQVERPGGVVCRREAVVHAAGRACGGARAGSALAGSARAGRRPGAAGRPAGRALAGRGPGRPRPRTLGKRLGHPHPRAALPQQRRRLAKRRIRPQHAHAKPGQRTNQSPHRQRQNGNRLLEGPRHRLSRPHQSGKNRNRSDRQSQPDRRRPGGDGRSGAGPAGARVGGGRAAREAPPVQVLLQRAVLLEADVGQRAA